MQISVLDSPLNDSMIARRLEILETATANQDSFEPQPPLTMWQTRRVSAIEEQWFALPTWNALSGRCERLLPDWREVDRLTAEFMGTLFDAAEHFYAAEWQAAEALHGYPEGVLGLLVGIWSTPHAAYYEEAQHTWMQRDTCRAVSAWELAWLARWRRPSAKWAEAVEIMQRRRAAERDLGRALFQDGWLDYVALTGTAVGAVR